MHRLTRAEAQGHFIVTNIPDDSYSSGTPDHVKEGAQALRY